MIIEQITNLVANCAGVSDLGGGVYEVSLKDGTKRNATSQEITDATTAQATADAVDATNQTDRAELKAQYQTAITRLEQIRDAASPTNAQVVSAVRDIARHQVQILKYLRGL